MHYVRRAGGILSLDWMRNTSMVGILRAGGHSIARGVVWFGQLFSTLPPIALPLALVFAFVFFFVYVKLTYPFWSGQPVFHTYDGWRYLVKKPYVIQTVPPTTHKYHHAERVMTVDFFDLSRRDLKRVCEFLQSHWVSTDRMFFTIARRSLAVLFSGHFDTPYVSIYWQPTTVYTTPTVDASGSILAAPPPKEMAGCLFSRPIRMRRSGTPDNVELYYLDFFCVNQAQKESSAIGRTLFQTHQVAQRTRNQRIPISMFKKETDLCKGVVPFVKFATKVYAVPNQKVPKWPKGMSCTSIRDDNMHVFYDFMQMVTASTMFQWTLVADMGNMVACIKAKEWFVYAVQTAEGVLAMYVFRNTHIRHDETEARTIELIASVSNTADRDVFYTGFLHALRILAREESFSLVKMSDIGHNAGLIERWNGVPSIVDTQSAYYLFNYVCPSTPVEKKSCLLLIG